MASCGSSLSLAVRGTQRGRATTQAYCLLKMLILAAFASAYSTQTMTEAEALATLPFLTKESAFRMGQVLPAPAA